MIQVIYYLFFSITLFYGLYYAITGLWGFFKPKDFQIKPYLPQKKFAIIIPARNEADVVGHLVTSLKNSNYPDNLYDVYVAVNNTTDNSKEVALKAGAKVIDVKVKVKSKGEVLRYVFNELKDDKSIDAYIIFDADNIVHQDFLSRMNDTLCSGYRVAQGFRDSKNITDNWISGSYSLYYYMQNFFFNKSRMTLGTSGSINGTGFMVSKEKIDKEGFDTKTLTEDIEFTAQCSLKNEPIAFVESAITYDEQPVNFKASWKQRTRWSVGSLQCLKIYKFDLLKHFLKTGNSSSFDMFMNFFAPIIQVVCLLEFIALILFKIFNIQLYDVFSTMFSSGILFLAMSYISGVIVSIFVIKYNKRKSKNVISAIVLFAIFILTWVPINVLCLFKKDLKWEEIKHQRGMSVKDVGIQK